MSKATYYRRRLTHLACRYGAIFLKRPDSDRWLRLEGTGRRIWDLLEYPTTVEAIAGQLECEFAGDPARVRRDVAGFLSALEDSGLTEAHRAPPSAEERQRHRYLGLLKRALVNLIYPEHELRLRFLESQAEPMDKLERIRYLRDIRYLEPSPYRNLIDSKYSTGIWRHFSHTMIGLSDLDHLEQCAETVFRERIPGDFMEAGVCQGGAAIFLRALQVAHGEGRRRLWAADSFRGLPEPSAGPDLDAGLDLSERKVPAIAFGLEGVRDNFIRYGLLDEGVEFLPGWFEDTLAAAPIGPLAILRLDADLYASTRVALECLYPRLAPGGFMVIDDYGYYAVCRQAVDEYRARHGITEPIQAINAQAVCWRKG